MSVPMKVIEAVCDRYKEGLSQRQVAENVGVGLSTVSRILQERGMSRPRGYRTDSTASSDGSVQLAMKKEILRHVCMERVCPVCGNDKHLQGSRFCMECGALLATKQEFAMQALHNLREYLEPYRTTKNMDRVFRDLDVVTEYVKGVT